MQDYERLAEIVVPASLPGPVSRDLDDDVVLGITGRQRVRTDVFDYDARGISRATG